MQSDTWYCYKTVGYCNTNFEKYSIIGTVQYLSGKLFVINYKKSKEIYYPETVFTVIISASVIHFCVNCFSVHFSLIPFVLYRVMSQKVF